VGDGEALGGREHPATTLGPVDPVRRRVKVVLRLLLVAAVVHPVPGLTSVAALPRSGFEDSGSPKAYFSLAQMTVILNDYVEAAIMLDYNDRDVAAAW